jgi:hypothetical protein
MMEEPIFSLEAEAQARPLRIFEIERDKAASRFLEIKRRLFRLALKTVFSLLTTVTLFKIFYPQSNVVLLLVYWIPFLILINNPEIISLWPERREAKQQLKSWDTVKKDYEKLKEQE